MTTEFFILFLIFSGFIIGLGAVTVIDLHGFLGRKSEYWTQATISAHKITKPLIWIGTVMVTLGMLLYNLLVNSMGLINLHLLILLVLSINGCFLSFWLSPRFLEREKLGQGSMILPNSWQQAISVSFIISFFGWWGNLALFVYHIAN